MKRFFDPCSHYREKISLLVSEASPEAGRTGLEKHLSNCADCRRYRDEIVLVAGALLAWKENFANVRPDDEALARWDGDFADALKPNRVVADAFALRVLGWCKDMIWPMRRIWAGLATVWVVILAANFSERSPSIGSVAKSAAPSPELVRAFFEGEGSLDQPIHNVGKKVDRSPAPRSEGPSGPASNQSI
jgi:hypothetical protein